MQEPEMQLVFNQLPGNFLIMLPDAPMYTIVAVSDAYNKATLTEREQLEGKGLFEAFPDNPDDPEATGVANLSASLGIVIQSRKPHKMPHQKYDIKLPDGHGFEVRYWRAYNSPVLNKQGEVVYLIHQVEDITDRMKTAEALESKTTILERTNQELEQFVRISSHDLQEPLRKIRTFIDLVKSSGAGKLDNRSLEHLETVEKAAERMSNRMKDLLKYAFLQQEELMAKVDLNEVLNEVLEDLSLLVKEKSATIQIQHLPSVTGIRHQLHQLFYNLIINSLQFSRPDPLPHVKISVNTEAVNHNRPNIEIIIADNGIGFDQHHSEKIFTVFERLRKNFNGSGTGIGLAICRKVVYNHGGSIFAISSPGNGASFHVLLPA